MALKINTSTDSAVADWVSSLLGKGNNLKGPVSTEHTFKISLKITKTGTNRPLPWKNGKLVKEGYPPPTPKHIHTHTYTHARACTHTHTHTQWDACWFYRVCEISPREEDCIVVSSLGEETESAYAVILML